MSWRDRLREASFRGVAFMVDGHDHGFGRRTDVHEYALRAVPWVEDLGRAARSYSLDAYLIGPDYDLARDQLVAALEAEGPATLIHPWLGPVTVCCTTSSLRETIRRGGEAGFRLDFIEAGENTAPDAGEDTQALARDAATATGAQAAEGLAGDFATGGHPGFVLDAAVARIGDVAQAMDRATAPIRSATDRAGAFMRRVDRLRTRALSLAGAPADLAGEMLGLVRDIAGLARTPSAALAALRPLLAFGSTLDAVLGQTPGRSRERANQTRLVRALRQAAAAESVRMTASLAFASYDEAVAARDALADAIDTLAVEAADAGDDAAWSACEALRRALVRDVTARGGSLQRIGSMTVPADAPLLVVAHGLYGDAGRSEEVALRNRVRHPGFIAAGTTLQVLGVSADG